MDKEPLITVATITAAVSAVLALLVAFGLTLTEAQSVGILGVTGVVAPLAVAWIGRRRVTSPATLRARSHEPPA